MLVKFFTPDPKKGATGGLDYLLNPEGRAVAPELLSGDPELTRQLLQASTFKNPYTTGCLSFAKEESDISRELEQELMQSFEQVLLSGLEPNQYDILWIKHTDKDNRLELNFHILNTELSTGKCLQPYIHKFDCRRIDAWKSLQNDIHYLANPNSPKRKRLLKFGSLHMNNKSIKETIHNYLSEKWICNEINNRFDIIKE